MSDPAGIDYVDPTDAVETFAALLRALPDDDWTDGPLAVVAKRYRLVKEVQEGLNLVQGVLEMTLVDSMDTEVVVVPSVGRLERSEATRWSWAYEGAADDMRQNLADAVAREVSMDVATG